MRWHRLLTCELNLHNYPQGIATSKRVKFWWTRDEWFKLRRIFKHDWPQYLIFPLYARATKLLFKALADPAFSGQAVTRTVKNISVYNTGYSLSTGKTWKSSPSSDLMLTGAQPRFQSWGDERPEAARGVGCGEGVSPSPLWVGSGEGAYVFNEWDFVTATLASC